MQNDSKRIQKLSFKARNPTKTKEQILKAATDEFSRNGFKGARVGEIVRQAGVNMRMLYHYFANKEGLYIAVLERVYRDVRVAELNLDLEQLDPEAAIDRLVEFTFEHFWKHPDLINLVMGENMLQAKYLKQSNLIPSMNTELQRSLGKVLKHGAEMGKFRRDVDPAQLWISIFSLCWVHLSNKHTLSWGFGEDLTESKWLEIRCQHVMDMIRRYLRK